LIGKKVGTTQLFDDSYRYEDVPHEIAAGVVEHLHEAQQSNGMVKRAS